VCRTGELCGADGAVGDLSVQVPRCVRHRASTVRHPRNISLQRLRHAQPPRSVGETLNVKVSVSVEFKVTLHEQVRYRGTSQYQKLQSVTQPNTMVKSTMTETCSAVLRSRRNCSSDGAERTDCVRKSSSHREGSISQRGASCGRYECSVDVEAPVCWPDWSAVELTHVNFTY